MKKHFLLFLALVIVMVSAKSQTVPNAGFEDWTTDSNGVESPNTWAALTNFAPVPFATIVKSTDKHSGTYAAKLSPISFQGMALPAILQVSFPSTSVGNYLNFYAKTTATSADSILAVVFTNDTNGNDGSGSLANTTVSNWTSFYLDLRSLAGTTFDTVTVGFYVLGTSPSLSIDDISFGSSPVGTVFGTPLTGLKNMNSQKKLSAEVFPNPAQNMIQVQVKQEGKSPVEATICDITGKQVMNATSFNREFSMDCSSLPAGMYFIHLQSAEGSSKQKLIISR